MAFGVYPLFLPLAITAFGAPGGFFTLAIIAFGAFEFVVPKYYVAWGKGKWRSLDSLFKEVTVFKGIGATGPRASERELFLERVSEREDFQRSSEVFRGFQRFFKRFSEVFRDYSEVFRGPLRDPLRDPLRGRFLSQRLSVRLPLIVLPLELSPISEGPEAVGKQTPTSRLVQKGVLRWLPIAHTHTWGWGYTYGFLGAQKVFQ